MNYGSTITKKLDIATTFQIILKGEIKLQFCVNLCKKIQYIIAISNSLRNSHQAHTGSRSDTVTCRSGDGSEAAAEAVAGGSGGGNLLAAATAATAAEAVLRKRQRRRWRLLRMQPKLQRHCSNRLYCFFVCLPACCLHFVGL